jgi:hypothetical protein
MIPISLADILIALDHISEVWRSETAIERRSDLADLLARLDDMEPDTSAETERVDELRGRIEILMDEIEISLGTEPTPITTEDLDTDPRTCGLSPSMPAGQGRRAHASDHTNGTKVHPALVSPRQRADQRGGLLMNLQTAGPRTVSPEVLYG